MKSRTVLFALMTSCAMATPALADMNLTGGFHTTNPYVGASIGLLQYSEGNLPGLSPSMLFIRAGLPLSSFFAIEGRVGTGLSSDQTNGDSVSIGTYGGAYAKGSLALTPTFSVYGVAGIATVNVHRNFRDGDTTNTGLSGGVGGDLQLERALGLNFEWTYLPSGTDAGHSYNSNLFSVGVNYQF